MEKKSKYTFTKMDLDTSPDKHRPEVYYKGRNIRVVTDGSNTTGAVINEKGDSLYLEIPQFTDSNIGQIKYSFNNTDFTVNFTEPSVLSNIPLSTKDGNGFPVINPDLTNNKICGYGTLNEYIFLFTVTQGGFNAIWQFDTSTDPIDHKLIYANNLGISLDKPIRRALANKENEDVSKIYFTNEGNLLRAIKLGDESINTPLTNLDLSPSVNYTNIQINDILLGGQLSPGVVQYAYSLYTNIGTETKISPLSLPITISNVQGGTPQGQDSGRSVEISINDIDQRFDFIKIFRVKYEGIASEPRISLIEESRLTGGAFTYIDGGGVDIADFTLDEFEELGGRPFEAKDITVKDSRMIAHNIKYKEFDVDFDARAYRFDSNRVALLKDPNKSDITINASGNNPDYDIDKEHSCINPSNKEETQRNNKRIIWNNDSDQTSSDYFKYIYQSDGQTVGAEGPNLKVSIEREFFNPNSASNNLEYIKNNRSFVNGKRFSLKSLKRDEVYRFAIRFINDKGQRSFPKWICDLRMPNNKDNFYGLFYRGSVNPNDPNDLRENFRGLYINVQIKDFSSLPSDIVGYEIVRAERKITDRTIIAQGYLNSMLLAPFSTNQSGSETYTNRIMPSWSMRTWHNSRADSVQKYQNRISHIQSPRGNSANLTDLINQNLEGSLVNHNLLPPLDATSFFFYSMSKRDELKQREGGFFPSSGYRTVSSHLNFYSPEVDVLKSGLNISEDNYLVISAGVRNARSRSWQYKQQGRFIFNGEKLYVGTGGTIGNTTYTGSNSIISIDEDEGANFNAIVRFGGRLEPVAGANPARINLKQAPLFSSLSRNNSTINLESDVNTKPFAMRQDGSDRSFFESNHRDNLILRVGSLNDSLGPNSESLRTHLGGESNFNTSSKVMETDSSLLPEEENGLFVLSDLKRSVPNQYGGDSYSSIQNTQYIPVSGIFKLNETNVNVINGDTFLTFYNFMRMEAVNTSAFPDREDFNEKTTGTFSEVLILPIETSINLDLREDYENNTFSKLSIINKFFEEEFIYNERYNREPNSIKSQAKPFNFNEIAHFPNRNIFSDNKINGQIIDGWLKYRPLNFYDANNIYGPINGAVQHNDEIYIFQDLACGWLRVNPRNIVQSTDGIGIEQGTGRVIQDVLYLTTNSGTKNQFSICATPSGIYYYDTLDKQFKVLDKDKDLPESMVKGIFSYSKNINEIVNTDNPYVFKGIHTNYWKMLKEGYFNVSEGSIQQNETIAHNFLANGFTSFYDYKTPISIPVRSNMYHVGSDLNKLYLKHDGEYGSFQGDKKDSEITFIVNHSPDFTKTLDNALYNSKVTIQGIDVPLSTLTSVIVENDYQSTGEVPLIVNQNVIRKFREWRINFPRESGTMNRMRSQVFFVTFKFENTDNKKLVLYDVIISHNTATAAYL